MLLFWPDTRQIRWVSAK